MIDSSNELIYVGKAKCLRARLLSYFRSKSRDPKAGRILRDARAIVWEPATCEFAALLRELELIRRFQPHLNVQGQPKRRQRVFLCLGRQPAPHLFLARKPPRTAVALFGPVAGVGRARESVRRLNDLFGLRDCPQPQVMIFSEQNELFPMVRAAGCIRHEIGTCVGPCTGGCSATDYGSRVRAARRFLDGSDVAILQAMEKEMAAASAALSFESAAGLRDKVKILSWLNNHLGRLRHAAAESFIYRVPNWNEGETWYVVHHGRVRAAVPAPLDDSSYLDFEALVRKVQGKVKGIPNSVTMEETDGVLLVAAWFRRHPDEWARVEKLILAGSR